MALWSRLLGRKAANNSLELLSELFAAGVKSGVTVNLDTALQTSVVLACTRVLAEGIAQLPLKLYQESADGRSRRPARADPRFDLLHAQPNEWQTSFEFREQLMTHAVLCGNGYALKNVVNGRLVELLPLEPQWVTVERAADWSLRYRIRPRVADRGAAPEFTAAPDQVLHLRGPSWNGIRGLEIFRLAREAIGLAIATEEHHARMHARGARTPGIYSVEGVIKAEDFPKLREWIQAQVSGPDNAWKPIVLDRAGKWISQEIKGVDSEHLATRRFQIEEVCRGMRVFPQMVMQSDKTSTFASAGQFFLAHVIHSLGPWIERLEQRLNLSLLAPAERAAGLFFKLSVQGLLRGDATARGDFYQKGILSGWLARNEVRNWEELDAKDGLDEPLTPVNMTTDPSGASADISPPEPEPES